MKKNLFYLFALICSMSLFSACSDDDPDYSTTIEQEMVGDYKGALEVSVGGAPSSMPQKISVTKAGATSVNLVISNFSFGGMPLGDIKLLNCQLEQDGNKYTCERKEDITLAAPIGTVPAQVGIVIEGGKVTVSLDITWNSIPVAVVYKGTRLKGSESKEAKITAFSFDMTNEANSIVIEQPVINSDNTITFKVDKAKVEGNADLLKGLVPTFTISDKATALVESGKAINLSADVTITVVAEDGTAINYIVKAPTKNFYSFFGFDDWKYPEYGLGKNNTMLPTNIWASGASAGGILGGILLENEPTGEKTYAARLTTFEYPDEANALIPKITAGSLYTGKFDMMAALVGDKDRLKCTLFGVKSSLIISGKPLFFKGVYKYKSGEKYLDASVNLQGDVIAGKKDECAIQAVLYEAKDADGKEVTLNGRDINDSKYIVAAAVLADGTEKAEFTPFNIAFEFKAGKEYKADVEYKFAIVCSSSKEGDRFKGAGGSTLVIDNFEVICE